jgi:hypothetical protein
LITITLNKIRAYSPCESGWKTLLKAKADIGMDDEFPLADVIDSNGMDDTLWCLRCLPEHDKTCRLFAVWCARQVQHLMTDQRSLDALDVAERHAHGLATDEELAAARDAAGDAARDAEWSARDAALAARDAAWDAAWDARVAAWDARAARAAARDAARDAALAARDAAWDAAWDAALAARDAAWDARAAQEEKLRGMIND